MEADSGVHLEVLNVDGGITANDLCMQIQADVLGVDVVRGGARRGLRRLAEGRATLDWVDVS
jgi:glycerol kinase